MRNKSTQGSGYDIAELLRNQPINQFEHVTSAPLLSAVSCHIKINKTGARQYTRAVLTEIHSTQPISAYIFLLFAYANMAGKSCLSRSRLFVVWLSLTIILGSQKPAGKLNNKANDVYVSSGLDVKHFPSRNSGSSRNLRESCVPPSWKCVIGLMFGNIFQNTLTLLELL